MGESGAALVFADKHWLSVYDVNGDGSSHQYVTDYDNGVRTYDPESLTYTTAWKGGDPKSGKPCTNMEKSKSWAWASDDCSHRHLCTCEYY